MLKLTMLTWMAQQMMRVIESRLAMSNNRLLHKLCITPLMTTCLIKKCQKHKHRSKYSVILIEPFPGLKRTIQTGKKTAHQKFKVRLLTVENTNKNLMRDTKTCSPEHKN
jgi:hypothetical protein